MIPSGILCTVQTYSKVSQPEDIGVTMPDESKKCVFSGVELKYAAL